MYTLTINALHIEDNYIVISVIVHGNSDTNNERPIVSSNVEIALGSKIIGKISIDNNAIIVSNSVVIKDVPNSRVVSGVPVKFLKMKE